MPDPNVDRWRQRGRIAMWTEPNSSAWNFCADATGCDSLISLLQLMENAEWSSKASLKLSRPKMTASGDPAQIRFANNMTIAYPKGRVAEDHWGLAGKREPTLKFGLQGLQEFKSAINDIKVGKGDYSIGESPNELWIWWWVDD